jgi:predicted RNase H-like nuclease (RuvC/YqgF family)
LNRSGKRLSTAESPKNRRRKKKREILKEEEKQTISSLTTEIQNLKMRLESFKARNKNLEDNQRALNEKISVIVTKNNNDDEYIQALQQQNTALKKKLTNQQQQGIAQMF